MGSKMDDILKDFIPHYGHQYCNEICPNFRAKASLKSALLECVPEERANERSGAINMQGVELGVAGL